MGFHDSRGKLKVRHTVPTVPNSLEQKPKFNIKTRVLGWTPSSPMRTTCCSSVGQKCPLYITTQHNNRNTRRLGDKGINPRMRITGSTIATPGAARSQSTPTDSSIIPRKLPASSWTNGACTRSCVIQMVLPNSLGAEYPLSGQHPTKLLTGCGDNKRCHKTRFTERQQLPEGCCSVAAVGK